MTTASTPVPARATCRATRVVDTDRLRALVNALTGDPVPYLPPLGLVGVLGGTTLLALATTVLPIGRLLRTPPVQDIGLQE